MSTTQQTAAAVAAASKRLWTAERHDGVLLLGTGAFVCAWAIVAARPPCWSSPSSRRAVTASATIKIMTLSDRISTIQIAISNLAVATDVSRADILTCLNEADIVTDEERDGIIETESA